MAKFLTLDDVKVHGKTVLVRVDFNSPIDPETKTLLDNTRIRIHANSTIRELVEKRAKTVLLAHQGRPGSQDFVSLKQHAQELGKTLSKRIIYVNDLYGKSATDAIKGLSEGEVLVLGNTRNYSEEQTPKSLVEHSKSDFIKTLAPLADIFVIDAFSAAHRSHASVVGFSPILPSVAGRVMERELNALKMTMDSPDKPCIFILGGAKSDDSLEISKFVLKNEIADFVLTGGVTSQLFLVAIGYDLGTSNMQYLEKQEVLTLVPGIRELMRTYPNRVYVPTDVAVSSNGKRKEISVKDLPTENPIFDIGTRTVEQYSPIIEKSKTIFVSGPLGVYEKNEFLKGTKEIFEKVASSKAFSLIGGGHTIAAMEQLGLSEKISYISTAGGALMEFLMGKKLPAVAALEEFSEKTKNSF